MPSEQAIVDMRVESERRLAQATDRLAAALGMDSEDLPRIGVPRPHYVPTQDSRVQSIRTLNEIAELLEELHKRIDPEGKAALSAPAARWADKTVDELEDSIATANQEQLDQAVQWESDRVYGKNRAGVYDAVTRRQAELEEGTAEEQEQRNREQQEAILASYGPSGFPQSEVRTPQPTPVPGTPPEPGTAKEPTDATDSADSEPTQATTATEPTAHDTAESATAPTTLLEGNVGQVEAGIADLDAPTLRALLSAEVAGKNRAGVRRAIEARLAKQEAE